MMAVRKAPSSALTTPIVLAQPQRQQQRDYGPDIRMPEKSRKSATPDPPVLIGLTPLQKRQVQAAAVTIDPMKILIKESRDDPATAQGGLVIGARVRDPLRRMFNAQEITKRQFDAVEAFRDTMAIAAGATTDRPEQVGIHTAPTNRNWPSESVLIALNRLRLTVADFADDELCLLVWTVVEHKPVQQWARSQGTRKETAAQLLRTVLTKLARRYTARSAFL